MGSSTTVKKCKCKTLYKLDFKIEVAIYLHKNSKVKKTTIQPRKLIKKGKTKQSKIEKKNRCYTPNPTQPSSFKRFFTNSLTALSRICLWRIIYVTEIMLCQVPFLCCSLLFISFNCFL